MEDLSTTTVLTATGWGITENRTLSEDLRSVNLSTSTLRDCQAKYSQLNETLRTKMKFSVSI